MKYQEIKQDLFQMDKEYALAHCISKDVAMGAGIAKEFRRRFPMMPSVIAATNPQIGEAKAYGLGSHIVFNLITKEKYWHKPTKKTFEMSIHSLKNELKDKGITKLAIPQLGAGLDRLNWGDNREMIQRIFADTDIEIVVCLWK